MRCSFKLFLLALASLIFDSPLRAQSNLVVLNGYQAHPTKLLARYRSVQTAGLAKASIKAVGLSVEHEFKELPGLVVLDEVPRAIALQSTPVNPKEQLELLATRMQQLEDTGLFRFVQPNWVYTNLAAPGDSAFTSGLLWGLRNTGNAGGKQGADVDAVRAWDLTTGSTNVIVAVIDTGIRYTHQDLAAQMWRNPGEIPGNGADDDNNGVVDDIHGVNAVSNNGDPFDDNDHGTHVAGTIGAAANNGFAHVGVAWNVRLMACKFLAAEGFGFTADAIKCINYATAQGAKILNNSWGGGPFDDALFDSIAAARSKGVLFVAAAGNSDNDNDALPSYPASYALDNVVAVAALDRRDLRADFSNYGATTVHLGAPGVDVYSSTAENDFTYEEFSGTSMASPHVAGVAALILAYHPTAPLAELRQRLIATTVPVSDLKGKTVSGGRVNAYNALIAKGDDVLELSADPAPDAEIIGNQTYSVYATVTDLFPVTNATVKASIDGQAGEITFLNNGVFPDEVKDDAVYTAFINLSKDILSISLDFNITAPGKSNLAQRVSYVVLQQPENDSFAQAIVLPPEGSLAYATNKAASVEQDEPRHANVVFREKSLWWNWTPRQSGKVIMDTAGSTFDTVIAVYINNVIRNLRLVAQADNIPSPDPIRPPRVQGYVQFDANAGTTYRIAVASASRAASGVVRLRVQPGGEPDNLAPSLTILSPPSGIVVTNIDDSRLTVNGTAMDPQPNGSGLKEVLIQINEDVARSAIGLETWTSTNFLRIGENTIRLVATDVAGNATAARPLRVVYRPLLSPNDLFAQAAPLIGTDGVVPGNTLVAGRELNEPVHNGTRGGKSVWWIYEPQVDGVLTVATTNSTFQSILAVYTGDQLSALKEVVGKTASDLVNTAAKVTAIVRAQQRYRIAVDGVDGNAGKFELLFSLKPTPVFTLTATAGEGGTVEPASGVFLSGDKAFIEARPAANFDFDRWEGTINSTDNPLEITVNANITLTARFRAKGFTDGFESGDLTKLRWSNSSTAPWVVQKEVVKNGQFALRSGNPGNGRNTALRLVQFCRAGTGRFALKVSSEETWDTLSFFLNNNRLGRWSGEVGWIDFEFVVPAGTNTFEWRYAKDAADTAEGLDAAFIDNLDLPLTLPVDVTTPANLSIELLSNGRFQVRGTGQAGQNYVIQSSEDLRLWQPVSTNTATGGVLRFLDPPGPLIPARFFRAVVP